MKRSYCLMILFLMLVLVVLSGCSKNPDEKLSNEFNENQKVFSIESFCNEFNGYWGYNDDGNWEILQIDNDRLKCFTYQGHMWHEGNIINIEQEKDSLVLTIIDEPVSYGDDPTEKPFEINFVFKSNDGFNKSLIEEVNNIDKPLLFFGSTIEDVGTITKILERPIILEQMSELYEMADLDWQSWSNYTNITFWDIISRYFDTDSLVWNSNKDELEIIHLIGEGESINGNVKVYLSFIFANETPMIVFNQMKKDDEILYDLEINEIAEKYNLDEVLGMAICDATAGVLFLSSFFRI